MGLRASKSKKPINQTTHLIFVPPTIAPPTIAPPTTQKSRRNVRYGGPRRNMRTSGNRPLHFMTVRRTRYGKPSRNNNNSTGFNSESVIAAQRQRSAGQGQKVVPNSITQQITRAATTAEAYSQRRPSGPYRPIPAFSQVQGESIRQQTGEEKLITAIKNKDEQAALELIEQGASLTVKDEEGNTPLSLACEHLPAVALVIAKKPRVDVNTKDNTHSTPLMKASLIGYTDLVDILLQKGANIDEKNESGYTALYYACAAFHPDTAMFLIRKGATITQHDLDRLVPHINTYKPSTTNMTEVMETLPNAIKGGRRRRSRTKRGPRGHKTRKNRKHSHKKN